MNNEYLNRNLLNVEIIGRGLAWLDTGTHDSLLEASRFVQTIEKRQGLKIGCLEEIAYNNNWITKEILFNRYEQFKKTDYGMYLKKILDN